MSKGPSVTVYDEQEYTCQPGETWESISKRVYQGTDQYAKALQRHNQNHARASDPMARTGQLTPGTKIFIPQAYVLEDRYADAIPRSVPAASPTVVPTTLNVPNSSQPPPVPPPASGTVPPPGR